MLILPHLTFPASTNLVQKGIFPCKVLYSFHATKQFLKQFFPFIRPHHRLPTNQKQGLHDFALHWGKDKDGEPCQGTRPQEGHEYNKTDRQLDKCRPEHVKKTTAGVY